MSFLATYIFFILAQVKHVLGTEEVIHVLKTCGSLLKKQLQNVTRTREQHQDLETGTREQEQDLETGTREQEQDLKTRASRKERLHKAFLEVIRRLWGAEDSDLTIEEEVHFYEQVNINRTNNLIFIPPRNGSIHIGRHNDIPLNCQIAEFSYL